MECIPPKKKIQTTIISTIINKTIAQRSCFAVISFAIPLFPTGLYSDRDYLLIAIWISVNCFFLVSWQIQKTVFVFCWKIINRSRSGNNLSLIFLDFNRNAECPSLAFVLTVTDKCLKMLLFYSDISILEKYRVFALSYLELYKSSQKHQDHKKILKKPFLRLFRCNVLRLFLIIPFYH